MARIAFIGGGRRGHDAVLTGDRDAARRAAMLGPHTAGELALDEIASLVDAMIEAHGDLIAALR
jgi:alpha-galactosidase